MATRWSISLLNIFFPPINTIHVSPLKIQHSCAPLHSVPGSGLMKMLSNNDAAFVATALALCFKMSNDTDPVCVVTALALC
jgi:hypothetical protein